MIEMEREARTTRRNFVAVAVAAGATYVAAGPLSGAGAQTSEQPCEPDPAGIRTGAIAASPSGRTVWSADSAATTVTAHRTRDLVRRRSLDVGGAPLDIAVSPHGRMALVTTAHYDRPGLALIDLLTGEVDRIDAGPEPGAVAFGADGRSAWVVNGGSAGTIARVEPRSGRLHDPIEIGPHPRGLAVLPGGERALVAVNGDAHVAEVDLRRRRVARRIATDPFPYRLAASPDGERALVTHNGFGADAATPLDLERGRARRPVKVGSDPAGTVFTESGGLVLVAAEGDGRVALLDGHTFRRRRTVRRGGAPRAIAIAGRRAIVADGETGRLTSIRPGARR